MCLGIIPSRGSQPEEAGVAKEKEKAEETEDSFNHKEI